MYYFLFQTESVSPNNEEATSQSGGEISNISDYNNPVYNMIYPGYYVNCPSSQGKYKLYSFNTITNIKL